MAKKAALQINFLFVWICLSAIACTPIKKENPNNKESIDNIKIPNTIIVSKNALLQVKNGVYYYASKPYSGIINSYYPSGVLKSKASYYQGEQHGISYTYFESKALESIRNYRNGLAYGTHITYWENGQKKCVFNYINEQREGVQKQWYESGKPYFELYFKNDMEEGMQTAWRENGKIFMNYEVKNGQRYGLQKAALCYTLVNQTIK